MQLISNKIFFEEIRQQILTGKTVRIRAKGNSMAPFIKNGVDDLILEEIKGPVLKGMIVLAKLSDGNYVLHRVEKVLQNSIILKGDGNIGTIEKCTKEDVFARLTGIVHKGKLINEASATWKMYQHAWPANRFARKILLALYRRISSH